MASESIGLVEFDPEGRIHHFSGIMQHLLGSESEGLIGRRPGECDESLRPLLNNEPSRLNLVPSDGHYYRELLQTQDGRKVLVTVDLTRADALAEENAALREQVEELRLTDDLSGLPNRRAMGQALDLHISRSRRYQNPLSIMLVHVDTNQNPKMQPLRDEPLILAASRFLRDRLRWVDQVGRWDDYMFLAVLPETSDADARTLIEKMRAEQANMVIPDHHDEVRPTLHFGLACWAKGNDQRTLLRSAEQDLEDASDPK